MARRAKTATIYEIATRVRANGTTSYIVRWRVPGKPGTTQRTFTESDEAESLHGTLSEAAVDRERFDRITGMPMSMVVQDGISIANWCREFLKDEAQGYTPLARRNWCDDLVPLIVRSAPDNAPAPTDRMRMDIRNWLIAGDELPRESSRWLERWSPRLRDLERIHLSRIIRRCEVKLDGTKLAANSRSNRIGHVRQVLNEAVNRGVASTFDWPPERRGAQKKSVRIVDKRDLPVVSPAELLAVISASRNRDSRSFKYQVMTAVGGWAGLRPSEVFGLLDTDLDLPESGWGLIAVRLPRVPTAVRWVMEGDMEYDVPKSVNSKRSVPIPPCLVEILRAYVGKMTNKDGYLFPNGQGFEHWPESLALAAGKAGTIHLTPYVLRRTYASHLSASGVPHVEIAERMGHTVAILEAHYLRPVKGNADASNAQIEAFLS